MKPFAVLPLLTALLLAPAVMGETYAEFNGSTKVDKRLYKEFDLKDKTKLKVTVGCEENSPGTGRMRVYFYKRSPQGGWRQLNDLRILLQRSHKPKSKTFSLPEGEYKVYVNVNKVDYQFKLEDAESD